MCRKLTAVFQLRGESGTFFSAAVREQCTLLSGRAVATLHIARRHAAAVTTGPTRRAIVSPPPPGVSAGPLFCRSTGQTGARRGSPE